MEEAESEETTTLKPKGKTLPPTPKELSELNSARRALFTTPDTTDQVRTARPRLERALSLALIGSSAVVLDIEQEEDLKESFLSAFKPRSVPELTASMIRAVQAVNFPKFLGKYPNTVVSNAPLPTDLYNPESVTDNYGYYTPGFGYCLPGIY